MAIRYTYYRGDPILLKQLMARATNAMKQVIKSFAKDLDALSFWLSNLCQLVNCCRQYGREERYNAQNTRKQQEQRVLAINLAPQVDELIEVASLAFDSVLQLIESELATVVVPAIVENADIPAIIDGASQLAGKCGPDSLVRMMRDCLRTLDASDVPADVTHLLFGQLSHSIAEQSLENLMARDELFHWSRGMQIRYNLSHVEEFLQESSLSMPRSQTRALLAPITQASQLLQARKTYADITDICEMYDRLTTEQIVRILLAYSPYENEDGVPLMLIKKVQDRLTSLRRKMDPHIFDKVRSHGISIPFLYSGRRLEEMRIPEMFDPTVVRKI